MMIDCSGYVQMAFNPIEYAEAVAKRTGGRVYIECGPDNLDLPDPDKYQEGDILQNHGGVYCLHAYEWICLIDNRGWIPCNPKPHNFMVEEKQDTKQWIRLLEE